MSQIEKPVQLEQAKPLINMVAWDGVEPPTRGFSVRCSTN